MDSVEKSVLGISGAIGCLAVLVVLMFLGLFAWGFVEVVQWITSK